MTKAIYIKWLEEGAAKNYTDVFENDEFANKGEFAGLWHFIIGPKGGVAGKAQFDLKVHEAVAELDYTPYRAYNERNGAELGKMQIVFENYNCAAILQVLWQDLRDNTFKAIKFVPSYREAKAIIPFMPSSELKAGKDIRQVKGRNGQADFRADLWRAYGCCCVTGCAVEQALDAVHIDPYQSEASNHPQNGLLLRKDLHSLFDNNLLAFHPESRKVFFAPDIADDSNYRALHANIKLIIPRVFYKQYSPTDELLKYRWLRFQKNIKINEALLGYVGMKK